MKNKSAKFIQIKRDCMVMKTESEAFSDVTVLGCEKFKINNSCNICAMMLEAAKGVWK